MADVMTTAYQYKLRAGAPMSKGTPGSGDFVLHTFGAEETKIDVYSFTKDLPGSTDFRGQNGEYLQAQFSRLSENSGNAFAGKVIYPPNYVEEELIGAGED